MGALLARKNDVRPKREIEAVRRLLHGYGSV